MTGPKSTGLAVAALAAGLCLLTGPQAPVGASNKGAPTVRVGMVNTLFRDLAPPMVQVLIQPFGKLMKSQTGLNGEMVLAGDAHALGQQLSEEKLHLGVFHGVEFAWAQ